MNQAFCCRLPSVEFFLIAPILCLLICRGWANIPFPAVWATVCLFAILKEKMAILTCVDHKYAFLFQS